MIIYPGILPIHHIYYYILAQIGLHFIDFRPNKKELYFHTALSSFILISDIISYFLLRFRFSFVPVFQDEEDEEEVLCVTI